MMKYGRKLATSVFAALAVGTQTVQADGAAGGAPAQPPTLTFEQMKQLQREASYQGALALVKIAFFSEYCQHISNHAPDEVPAYRVNKVKVPVEDVPPGLQAYNYAYQGQRAEQKTVPEYCGRFTISGPQNPILDQQIGAFERMIEATSKVAGDYASKVFASQATTETLTEAYFQMQAVARTFQQDVLTSMVPQPFNPSGRPNLLGVSVAPPRPTLAGDAQVHRVLSDQIEQTRKELMEVIDANPIEGQRQLPAPRLAPKDDDEPGPLEFVPVKFIGRRSSYSL